MTDGEKTQCIRGEKMLKLKYFVGIFSLCYEGFALSSFAFVKEVTTTRQPRGLHDFEQSLFL